ncbi:methyl-accepting chemotaxis protein [Alteromonas sp. ASW11-130]|uniref:methyl-accepting chemotaxis protein n=1 Tax=Alteromonas sp. ASW11-130 TaxID=3015775 RepID=UPI002242A9E8|nr:methyl-accepting chemotaxis protein [Alteromonas sp. ASW11-130]MCW8092984.1 methyl-accepting chemotaxis protein [Alteromonas sp. ASW11-130]
MTKFLNNFSISQKLLFTAGLTAFAFLILILLIFYAVSKNEEINSSRYLLRSLDVHMLTMRRHEKDFLMRGDTKYIPRHQETFYSFENTLRELEDNLADLDIDKKITQTIHQSISRYRNAFERMVSVSQRIGLDENTGLLGELREAVKTAENPLKELNQDALLKDMLMLRRHEKDFLARLDPKYISRFKNDHTIFLNSLENSPIPNSLKEKIRPLMAEYKAKFLALALGMEEKGYSPNEGIRGEMRNAVSTTEKQIDEAAPLLNSAINDKQIGHNWFVIIVAFILVAIITALLIVITRDILAGLKIIKDKVDTITATGDFSLRIPVKRDDELGQIGSQINMLLENNQEAIQDSNQLLSDVSQHNFGSRITADYKGDLGLLKSGVNNAADILEGVSSEFIYLINSLSQGEFSIRATDKIGAETKQSVNDSLTQIQVAFSDFNRSMEQLSQGNFDVQIESQLQGEFERLREQINSATTALSSLFSETGDAINTIKNGRLTRAISTDKPGQFGVLMSDLESLRVNLLNVLTNIKNTALVVGDNAEKIEQQSEQLSEQMEKQAASTEEASASTNNIRDLVATNRKRTDFMLQKSADSAEVAKSCQTMMQSSIEVMHKIKKSSEAITNIISVIDEISFQTNLLALNASVEAARAGEHGRGFTVVAKEVQNLAQRSAESAQKITKLISESSLRVAEGEKSIHSSSQKISSVVDIVNGLQVEFAKINQDFIEQQNSLEEMVQVMTTIDHATQTNASVVAETNRAVESLGNQSQDMLEAVTFFQLEKR